MCVRALLAVMRSLPDHAIHQLNELRTTLFGLLQRCLVEGRSAQVGWGLSRTHSHCTEHRHLAWYALMMKEELNVRVCSTHFEE